MLAGKMSMTGRVLCLFICICRRLCLGYAVRYVQVNAISVCGRESRAPSFWCAYCSPCCKTFAGSWASNNIAGWTTWGKALVPLHLLSFLSSATTALNVSQELEVYAWFHAQLLCIVICVNPPPLSAPHCSRLPSRCSIVPV